jgi:ferredoxin
VLTSEFPLPDADALELRTLHRIGAADNVRLACQLIPSGGTVEVAPLYPADYSFSDEPTTPPMVEAAE